MKQSFGSEDLMSHRFQALLWIVSFLLFSIPRNIKADDIWSARSPLPALASDTDTSIYEYRSDIAHGTVWTASYTNYLGFSKNMRVYLPPNYDTSGVYYPVLYLNHGMGGNETVWTDVCNANYILDNLINEGKVVPIIIVMPRWDGPYFGLDLDSGPPPLETNDAVTEELIRDIIPFVESHYRAKSDRWNRAIAGLSLGGYVSLNTGLRRLDLFSEIFLYSPFENEYGLANLEQNYESVLTETNTNERFALPLYIAMGTSDNLWTQAQSTDALLSKYNIKHYYQSSSGGHEVMNWRRYLHQTAQVMFAPCTQNHPGLHITLNPGGAVRSRTGAGLIPQAGYGSLIMNSGYLPYGTAVFTYRQNGVTLSEAGVPASVPTTHARIFVDYRFNVPGVPARADSGTVDINTGIGIVNYGYDAARISYSMRNNDGAVIAAGEGSLAAGKHFAKFIDQLQDVASGFVLPSDFQFATLDIASDQPLSIVALRMTTNQRGEPLFSTTPIADLNQRRSRNPIYFPQLADGGGWTTSVILFNTSGAIEEGSIDIFDDNGFPFSVRLADGRSGSSFRYVIPAGGALCLQTDGSPGEQKAGWARLIPDLYGTVPIASGVFSFNPFSALTTESGIPSAIPTTHARVFVDLTKNHNTGLAIANLAGTTSSLEIRAFQKDGVTPAGVNQEPLLLAGSGHSAKFADQFISGLPAGFTGVLDISGSAPFAAITVRSLCNEREDFLLTTFPVADFARRAVSPVVFPRIVDGGGYMTQFILLSPEGTADATLILYDENGNPSAVENVIE